MPLSVEHCTKSGKTGENVYKITKYYIRQLQVCYTCLGKTKSDYLFIVPDFSSCSSYCEKCYTLKSICTDSQSADHNSYDPQLSRCDVCTLGRNVKNVLFSSWHQTVRKDKF